MEKESGVVPWGDFEIHFDGVLGRGGMGTVYRAWQRSVGRWVAVKVLDAARHPDPDLQQGFLQKFQVEIQALARLNDPRIVTIYQSGNQDGRLWFAMELIDGVTVEQRLSEKGAFDEGEAARIGGEVARALDAALRQKIVHRDVKPANVFLLRDGSVKLADFGLARGTELSRTRLTDLDAVACTPEYASPEQGDGRATDHRSDLYSLGCVLFEMVAERPPFSGDSPIGILFKHSSEPPPRLRSLNPDVSAEYEDVVGRCLEKDPDARYQSYGELVDILSPPAVTSKRLMPAAARPTVVRRSWMWPAVSAAGVAVFGCIVAAILTAEAPAAATVASPPATIVQMIPVPAPAPHPSPQAAVAAPPPEKPPVPILLPSPPSFPLPRDVRAEIAAFRALLTDDGEVMGEVPWGTWTRDSFHAPGGTARYEPALNGAVLAARSERDLLWIRKRLAGARAGWQARFRFGSPDARAAFAFADDRRVELHARGAVLSGPVERWKEFAESVAGGTIAFVPGVDGVAVFLDDEHLFDVDAPGDAPSEGLQIGVRGGTIVVESVRVKERAR